MARFTGAKGKVCRRFGLNVYGNPKFDRLLSRRSNPPGQHGPNMMRRKVSEYGQQLIEKQKMKFTYGLLERQFRITFKRALSTKGITGDNLLILLESRLDNAVYRAGWAGTRDQARQLVNHGHLKINGRKVNVPSCQIREGDVISVKDSNTSNALITRYVEENASRPTQEWIAADMDEMNFRIERLPLREEIQSEANVQLVVELYSK